ncbi:hypothetical protein BCR34DRAFT_589822 [Clohesyomyces aquaticus]|uniref:Uncharacterized protein n=1 Tax=Clohesyomyces aquaticus TaxID=1231657 RepID=A0A1Y1ZEV5_9PLEO|nr:hypothetical protein BCR34DRAFT_589822 [Clohesyomyces aquaticus]
MQTLPTHSAIAAFVSGLLPPILRPLRTVCFLHRPWALERNRVRRDTLVLSSHTSFDEHSMVGWNTVLAERIGMDIPNCIRVQGYKGDSERKIGILGQVSMLSPLLLRRIKQEFGAVQQVFEDEADEIHAIAIMNVFNADQVKSRGRAVSGAVMDSYWRKGCWRAILDWAAEGEWTGSCERSRHDGCVRGTWRC